MLWLLLVSLGCSRAVVAPDAWPTTGCSAAEAAPDDRSPRARDFDLVVDDGTSLAVATLWPRGGDCRGVVVLVPPGFEEGASKVRGPQALDLAGRGYVVASFDPRGRGDSEGEEDANGTRGQDDLAAVLRALAWDDDIDPDAVVLYSRSYGGALASGALSRHDDLGVRAWVDYESPGWMQEDLNHAAEHNREVFDELTADIDDLDAWWSEREPAAFIGDVPVPYHRMQGIPDHALDYLQHAVAMVNGAVSAPVVTYNGEVVTAALTGDEAAALAVGGGLDHESALVTDEILAAFRD